MSAPITPEPGRHQKVDNSKSAMPETVDSSIDYRRGEPAYPTIESESKVNSSYNPPSG